jgi:hypothetical protein
MWRNSETSGRLGFSLMKILKKHRQNQIATLASLDSGRHG